MENETIEDRLKRYGRLMENADFINTIQELDESFNLDGSVVAVCNCPNASEYLFAREGMRTYRNTLMGLKKQLERQIKETKENDEDE